MLPPMLHREGDRQEQEKAKGEVATKGRMFQYVPDLNIVKLTVSDLHEGIILTLRFFFFSKKNNITNH